MLGVRVLRKAVSEPVSERKFSGPVRLKQRVREVGGGELARDNNPTLLVGGHKLRLRAIRPGRVTPGREYVGDVVVVGELEAAVLTKKLRQWRVD